MSQKVLDLDYLYELADNDPQYISDVIEIFLNNTPDGLVKLEELINEGKDWDAVYKQAHFLKSSFGIVKVDQMHESLLQIEKLARKNGDESKTEIENIFQQAKSIYAKAHLLILEELAKNKPAD